jgi:hypothetical protein
MAWGNRSLGCDDLVAQLLRNCTADTLCVMRSRRFEEVSRALRVGSRAQPLA